jgi:hypothetical protein
MAAGTMSRRMGGAFRQPSMDILAEMSGDGPQLRLVVPKALRIKTYASVAAVLIGAGSSLLYLLIGIAMITAQGRGEGGAAAVILGVVAVLLSIWIATLAAGGQLSFTAGEVEYGFPPRRRSIAWTSIVSFATVSYRPPWYCLVINTTSGSIRVPNIAGSRTFVARVAAELEAAQRQLAAGPVSSDRRPPAG